MAKKNNILENFERQLHDLEGDVIKDIFKNADLVAKIHLCISSPRGEYFRRHLLQMLNKEVGIEEIEQLRAKAGLHESTRHINKLLDCRLIEASGKTSYRRTKKGEEAINAIKQLETDLGTEKVHKIFISFLGVNAIRLFLTVYGVDKEADIANKAIKFSPQEIGKFSLFLPRSIEGIAALDKLSEAEILVYKDDGNIYLDPVRSRCFYQYLKRIFKLNI